MKYNEFSNNKPNLYLYLDIETTGLNKDTCGIIELSGMFEFNDSSIFEFELLINPFSYPKEIEVQEKALAVNNRTIDEIKTFNNQGECLKWLCDTIEYYVTNLGCNNPIILGYNVNFDIEFIKVWFMDNNVKYASYFNYKYIDIYQIVLNFSYLGILDFTDNDLKTMCLKLDVPLTSAHTAIEDIKATRLVHKKLIGLMSLVNIIKPTENLEILKNIENWGSKNICDKLGLKQTDFKKELLNG